MLRNHLFEATLRNAVQYRGPLNRAMSHLAAHLFKYEILENIPLFKGVPRSALTVSSLPGWTNSNYLITFKENQASYVLRIPGTGSEQYIDREVEAKNISIASSLEVTSENPFHDSSTGIQLRPFIEGHVLYDQLGKLPPQTVSKIGKVLRTLHRSPRQFINTTNQFEVIEQYKTLINRKGQLLNKEYDDLDRLMREVQCRLAQLSISQVPCHNDPNLANFILTPAHRLLLMDWEYAGNGDAAWDLGYVSNYGSFTPAEDEVLLKAYDPPLTHDPNFISRMTVYKPVSEWIFALWIRLQIINGHFPVSREELEAQERESLDNVQKNLSEQAFHQAFQSLAPVQAGHKRMGSCVTS